jgi:hypothetical protein
VGQASFGGMRTLFLRSLLIWLIFMPAAAVGLIV